MRKRLVIFIFALLTLIISTAGAAFAQDSNCGAQDYDCKIKYYQERIKTEPKNPELYFNLGYAFQGKGEHAQAVAMFDIYLASTGIKAEYMADGYNYRGYSYFKLEQNDLAIKDYTKAIELITTKSGFYYDRGLAYNKAKNFSLAIPDFTKAIEINKDDSSSYFERGFAYMESKDNVKAIPDFTKVMALDPGSAEAYYNRGTVYYRTKVYAKAIADLDKYIALNQASARFMADGYDVRGLSYFSSGDWLKAIDDFTKAIESRPDGKKAYVHRGAAYRKLNKIALAAADEKKAAELPEDNDIDH